MIDTQYIDPKPKIRRVTISNTTRADTRLLRVDRIGDTLIAYYERRDANGEVIGGDLAITADEAVTLADALVQLANLAREDRTRR